MIIVYVTVCLLAKQTQPSRMSVSLVFNGRNVVSGNITRELIGRDHSSLLGHLRDYSGIFVT